MIQLAAATADDVALVRRMMREYAAGLDSHRATMGPAIALYRSLGFVEIPARGPDRDGELAFFECELG
jgi:hypothetical protein